MRTFNLSSAIKKTLALSVLTLMTAQVNAQTVAQSIEFTGLSRVTPESLQVALPMSAGQIATDEVLAESDAENS
mgnify:CR=1 FL=1